MGTQFNRSDIADAVISSMTEGLIVGDAAGNILDMNPVSLRLHGFATMSEARRHVNDFSDTFEFWSPDGQFIPSQQWPLARALAGERFMEFVAEVRRVDTKQRRWISYGGAPVLDDDGRLEYVVLTARDITEQRATEQALLLSEQRSRQARESVTTILESISDAFFGLDRNWCFTYLNPQAEPLLQRKREDLLGKNVWEEFPAAVASSFYDQYGRAMRENIAVDFTEFYPPLGTWFEVHAYPTSDGLGVYFRDVTEQRRMEAQQRDILQRQRAFARDVLASVTDGRLRLCQNQGELPEPLEGPGEWVALSRTSGMRQLREWAKDALRLSGFGNDRRDDLATAASEAAMNAVVHAGDGLGRVCRSPDRVQVWVVDQGQGIAVEHLPRATLEKGYTTAGTLGQGFKLILACVDRFWLLTGPDGTTIVMEQDRVRPGASWLEP